MTQSTAPQDESPQDAAVREQALDPTRSFIVEAPAGSGKTELLTRRYLRLLATVRAPEEILAITFTRKAAAEMRNRVLRSLQAATQGAAKSTDSTREAQRWAQAAKEQDARYNWNLLSHPARLRIMTIDAFNQSLARQLPLTSGAGAAMTIARDPRSLYALVAARLLERLGSEDAHADAIERLLRHLDNRYEAFEMLLSNELARREYWLDLGLMRFESPLLRQRLQEALRHVVESELSSLRAAIPGALHAEIASLSAHAARSLRLAGDASAIAACEGLEELPQATAESAPIWRGIAELLLTKEGAWRAQISKRIGILPEHKAEKARLQEVLSALQREAGLEDALHIARALPAIAYDEGQWRVLTALLAVLKLAVAELELAMQERGEADYVAGAIAARRALEVAGEPTELALRLDYRLNHLLVDEFQDTSRGQAELLAMLTAGWQLGDGRTLFCVGDPMQSIYRFRHADVGLFLNIKRHGLNQLKPTALRLTVNFRSNAPVLNWVNNAFSRVLPRQDDPERGAVSYTPSSPSSAASHTGGVFVHALQGERATTRAEEAWRIGELIAHKLEADPAARIAVLVANRAHLQAIVPELRERGIAFQAVDIDPLTQRMAILDLSALTRALSHLADRVAWLALLRAPWCGLSLADLHALCGDAEGSGATIWRLLCDETRIAALSADGQARVRRIAPVLRMALRRRGRMSLRDCVERTWRALGGPATLSEHTELEDCEAYFKRVEEIERVGDLEDVAALETQLTDLYAAAANTGRGPQVELMTIHRSKGLEFDIVVLPALEAGARADDPPLLRAQELPELAGARALLLAPIAARGSEADSIYAWLERLEKDRARFEKGRLLYVAATRAKRELHLFGAVKTSDRSPAKPSANTFLSLLWPIVESEFHGYTPPQPVAASTGAGIANGVRTLRLPLSWRAPAVEPPLAANGVRRVIDEEPLHPEFEWAGEIARHVGAVVHREIERIARIGVRHAPLEELRASRERFEAELAELGAPPALRGVAAQRVVEALTRMLQDERGRWALAGDELHREAESEFALSGVVGGDIVNGVVDRTFVTTEGVRWVIDFKTSAHEGGGLDAFLDREAERYRPQLARYAKLLRAYRPAQAVKAALYFPLLGAWREVEL